MELPQSGLITQELIDQLVAANGEQEASEWIQKQRTVLLSHPGQVFSGQLRRYETKRKVGNTPLYWWWEKEFVKTAGISFFHRFRAIDQMNVACSVTTLTTVLPPRKKLPFFITRRPNQYFSVPSEKDRQLLKRQYQISEDRIFVARPTIRRFLHFQPVERKARPLAVFLVGERETTVQLPKLLRIIKARFPRFETKVIQLKNKEGFGPQEWLQLLAQAELCFYLTAKPFDWGTLALESLYHKIPTFYLEEHGSLSESLPHSRLKLNRFLVEQPELDQLKAETETAWETLNTAGTFARLGLANQYRVIYQEILP